MSGRVRSEWVLVAVGASIVGVSLLARPPAATADRLFGEPVGEPRTLRCPPERALAGLAVFGEDEVARVGLRCRGPAGRVWGGPSAGRVRRPFHMQMCPPDAAVVGIAVRRARELTWLAPWCAGAPGPAGRGVRARRCGPGQEAAGLHVRVLDGRVRAVGLVCRDPVTP